MTLLENLTVIVALGSFAWDGVLLAASHIGAGVPKPKPRFGHGARASVGPWTLIGSYHPSQQNTFTGKLTVAMLDEVFEQARRQTVDNDRTRSSQGQG